MQAHATTILSSQLNGTLCLPICKTCTTPHPELRISLCCSELHPLTPPRLTCTTTLPPRLVRPNRDNINPLPDSTACKRSNHLRILVHLPLIQPHQTELHSQLLVQLGLLRLAEPIPEPPHSSSHLLRPVTHTLPARPTPIGLPAAN